MIHSEATTYFKHHSFTEFLSSLGSDIDSQRSRVINLLKARKSERDQCTIEEIISNLSSDFNRASDFRITQHIADELSKIEDYQVCRYITHRYRYDVYPKRNCLDDYPPYLQIEPTSICNYRCAFCYQTDMEFTRKSSGHMGSMSFEVYKEVIDQVVGKIEFLSLSSRGEPFLCKDINRMLEYCAGKFLGLKVNTNASLLNEKSCHAVLAGGVNTIVFSVDAAAEPLYSQLRVRGNFERVFENIKLFCSIRRRHYPQSKVITRVSGVRYNDQQDLSSMARLLGDFVDQVSFVAYNPWENVYASSQNPLLTPCSDLWRRMFVWHDATVNPCDTDYKSTLSLGSVLDSTISQIWTSDAYSRLREVHLQGQRSVFEPCRRCAVV